MAPITSARERSPQYAARLRRIAVSRLPESARNWGGKSDVEWCNEAARICRLQGDEGAAKQAEAAISGQGADAVIYVAVSRKPEHLEIPKKSVPLTVPAAIIPASTDRKLPWSAKFFTWSAESDPIRDLEAWRQGAMNPSAALVSLAALDFDYAEKGPADIVPGLEKETSLGANRFGMIASAKISLAKGRSRIVVDGDDGVRVWINGKLVIDDWSYPRRAQSIGHWEQETDGEVDAAVEYFENTGWAQLRVSIETE
jgi:hypothetical protein